MTQETYRAYETPDMWKRTSLFNEFSRKFTLVETFMRRFDAVVLTSTYFATVLDNLIFFRLKILNRFMIVHDACVCEREGEGDKTPLVNSVFE